MLASTVMKDLKHSVRNKQDDIMLIKLDKKVKAKPQKIPTKQKDYPPGTKCVVTGWGTTVLNVLKPSDKLQKLEVTVVGRDECNRFYKNDHVITRDMMCAGNEEEKRGICWGDSGGPLECKKNILDWYQGRTDAVISINQLCSHFSPKDISSGSIAY